MRKSLTLTIEQWQSLESLAKETDSTATAGPSFGEPTWRALVRRIADKELIVNEQTPARPGKDE